MPKIQNVLGNGGLWSNIESAKHIHLLELLPVRFSPMSLLREIHNICIRIMSDNSTVVSYINEIGGRESCQSNEPRKEIYNWAIGRTNSLSAAQFIIELEWMFLNRVFQKILSRLNNLLIDLHASRLKV